MQLQPVIKNISKDNTQCIKQQREINLNQVENRPLCIRMHSMSLPYYKKDRHTQRNTQTRTHFHNLNNCSIQELLDVSSSYLKPCDNKACKLEVMAIRSIKCDNSVRVSKIAYFVPGATGSTYHLLVTVAKQ